MIGWFKVLVHCLVSFHRNFKGEDHRMSWFRINADWEISKKQHYCSCGYNESDLVKQYKPIIKNIDKAYERYKNERK